METFTVHRELLLDHASQTDQFETELGHHWVVVYVVEESVLDRLFRGVLVHSLFEDLAIRVPPTTEPLGRVDNVAVESLKSSFQICGRWVVGHLVVIE